MELNLGLLRTLNSRSITAATSNLYEEFPVSVEEFILSNRYLDLKGIVFQNIANILKTAFEENVQDIKILAGIGGGKSYFAAIVATYVGYRLLCLKDPFKYYRIDRDKPIAIVNTGPRFVQAKDVVFAGIKQKIESCPWFQQYNPSLLDTVVKFPKGIHFICGNSKSQSVLGYNVFAAVIDEAAFFPSAAEGDPAEKIYTAISRRITSRFGTNGYIVTISSPNNVDDFIVREFNTIKNEGKPIELLTCDFDRY